MAENDGFYCTVGTDIVSALRYIVTLCMMIFIINTYRKKHALVYRLNFSIAIFNAIITSIFISGCVERSFRMISLSHDLNFLIAAIYEFGLLLRFRIFKQITTLSDPLLFGIFGLFLATCIVYFAFLRVGIGLVGLAVTRTLIFIFVAGVEAAYGYIVISSIISARKLHNQRADFKSKIQNLFRKILACEASIAIGGIAILVLSLVRPDDPVGLSLHLGIFGFGILILATMALIAYNWIIQSMELILEERKYNINNSTTKKELTNQSSCE